MKLFYFVFLLLLVSTASAVDYCQVIANFTPNITTGNAPLSIAFTDTSYVNTTAYYENVNTTNLLGLYRFDEGSGTKLVDSSGLNHNSSSVSNIAWINSTYGTSGSFNGVNSYAVVPYTSLACNGSMSILTHFKTTNLTKSEQAIIGQTGGMVQRNYQPYLAYNKFKFLIANGTTQSTATFTTAIVANTTYFVAFTVSGKTVKMYLFNGATWVNETKTVTVSLQQGGAGEYKVGGMSTSYHNTMWEGTLDNLMVYNRTLSEAEIYSYNPAPTAWLWNFGDGLGSYAQNPVHVYYAHGTYSVNLTATNSHGSDSKVINDFIIPGYSTTITPCITALVNPNFENWTNYVAGNAPDGWIKDGATARGLNRSSDAAVGLYSVSVTGDQAYATCGAMYQAYANPQKLAKLNAWVKTNNNSDGGLEFYVWNGGERYKDVDHEMIENDTWTHFTFSITPPAENRTDAFIEMYSYFIGSNVWQVDGLELSNAYSQPAVETQIGQCVYQNSTYTPDQVYAHGTYETYFEAYNITAYEYNDVTATIDDVPVDTYSRGLFAYVDVSNVSVGPHALSIRAIVGGNVGTNFTSNNTVGKVPLYIEFNDTSTGTPTSWLWNFGDNTTSTEQNPIHEYNNTGTYTVQLTSYNGLISNTTTRTNYIWAQPPDAAPPITQFYANQTNIAIDSDEDFNVSVGFIDTTISLVNVSYFWVFGDCLTSTEQNPIHVYNATGAYDVSLTATNIYGTVVDSKAGYINITRAAPVVSWTADRFEGYAPMTVHFTNNTSNYTGTFFWDFGDGENSTEINPTHLFVNDGTYNTTLTLTRNGENYTLGQNIVVNYVTKGSISLSSSVADQMMLMSSSTDALRLNQTSKQAGMYHAIKAVESGASSGYTLASIGALIIGGIGLLLLLG